MHIAFVHAPHSRQLPDERHGDDSLGIWSVHVAQRLAPGHRIVMYGGTGKRGFSMKSEEENGVLNRGVPMAHETALSGLFSRTAQWAGIVRRDLPFYATRLFYPLYILRIALDIRRRKCDVIHVMNFSNFIPTLRTLNPKATIVLHMHCEWLTQLEPAVIERRLAGADLIIGCSEYISRKVRNRFPQAEGKCFTVWNGTDTRFFSPPADRKPGKPAGNLLFVGRVSPEKGVHVLLEAFRTVLDRYPQATLTIIGTVKSLPWDFDLRLEKDAATLELSRFYDRTKKDSTDLYWHCLEALFRDLRGAVRFLGGLQNESLPGYYRKADVLVIPSVWNEPFGMPLVEAMACGVPVVGSMGGGIVEVLDNGLYGLLADRNSAESLAAGILRVLDDGTLYSRLSETGLRQAREVFSWERTAETLLSVYRVGKADISPRPNGRSSLACDPG